MKVEREDNGLNETATAEGGDVNGARLAEQLAAGGVAEGGEGDEGSDLVVAAEPRRLNQGTLVMFAILVLGAGAVFFMYRQTGPGRASAAATAASAEVKAAGKTISTFLQGGDANIKLMETMLRSTEKVVQQFLSYPSMTQVPLSELRTNPFRVHSADPLAGRNLSDAAERKKREEERLAVLKAVQGLALQSIMYSESRRACMINNSLYLEGQAVDDFSIEKIAPTSVIVKNGPYRFELKMQR